MAIVHAEILAVWLIAVDMRDRPAIVTEQHLTRLAEAVQRLQALKAAV